MRKVARAAGQMGDFDLFVSYHWKDHAQVEALAQKLRGVGMRVFLDRWLPDARGELAQCA